ncbi:hypothetical protein HU200_051803 [Digitaria exilis]|uniref:Uncharacterized protein n=1 Tax=Digitaria exilis TaxID=1010633 RepID=A0A835AJM7_9POAL|nr:hypothetical protein HU200_051803 [Digitaria exilis]
MHEMACSQRVLLLMALLLLTLLATVVAGEGDDVPATVTDRAANATTGAGPPSGGTLDVRARKWWRFPATEGLVTSSERRVPNSSDPLHNR